MDTDNLREKMLLGMGNPLLDISAVVEENLLKKYDLKEDEAVLATDKHITLYNTLVDKYDVEYTAGGSVQNALRVAQWLLGKPNIMSFFGCVGDDEFSKILKDQAQQAGVNVNYQYTTAEPTGTCAVLVTNNHRTLCANLAAANCFTIDHIRKPENRKLIEAAEFYYVSGFFLTASTPSILEVAKYAHDNNRPFIMNLSAEFIYKFYREQFMQVLPYVDIFFGNEAEALAFSEGTDFNTTDLKEIALKMCKLPKQNEARERVVVITQGTQPVILAHKGKIQEFPVIAITKESIVDTNGAGDAFAGGFLAQYIQGKSFEICIKCGIWAATEIIQRAGCTFDGKPGFVERLNTLLGIGQPILDILVKVDDNFLRNYNLKENEAVVASEKHDTMFADIAEKYEPKYIAGGGIHNALSVIQWLVKTPKVTTFIGCVGSDEYSKILEEEAQTLGIDVNFENIPLCPTSTCAVLITNEHRTLCTKFGAANLFSIDHLKKRWKIVEDARYYYIMGFFLSVSPICVMEIAKHSCENRKQFVMNLSSEFICRKYTKEFLEIFPYVDVIFGNESEAIAFAEASNFNTTNLKEIILKLCKLPKQNKDRGRICVITRGTKPVIVSYEENIQEYPVIHLPREKIVDTNGAGDAFVGGFLSQFIQGESMEICVKCGVWAASEIVQNAGCRFNGKADFKKIDRF